MKKNYNLTYLVMFSIMFLTGCRGQTVYVFHMSDIIGISLLSLAILTYLVVYLYSKISNKIKKWRKK